MFKTLKSRLAQVAVAGGSALAVPAFAVYDPAAVVTEIAAATAPALAVGGAVIVGYASIWLFKLIRRAM